MIEEIKEKFGNRIRIRVCGILIRDNQILLANHRGIGKHGTMLIPPGGGVEFGESLRQTLKREFYEETGLQVQVGDFLSLYEFIEPPLHALEFFFLVTAENTQIPHTGTDPELKENQIIESVNFVTFDKLRIMDNEYKHRILHEINDRQGLLNLKGRFKLS